MSTPSNARRAEAVGHRIKDRRELLGRGRGKRLTQQWLADQVGVTKSSVTKWEIGESVPEGENLLTLARVLETTPEEILGVEPGEQERQATQEETPKPHAVREQGVRYGRRASDGANAADWISDLVMQIMDSSEDARTKLALIAEINATGRTQAAILEALGGNQRASALVRESGGAETRAATNHSAEQTARERAAAARPAYQLTELSEFEGRLLETVRAMWQQAHQPHEEGKRAAS